jgi:hypothetical protein
MLTRGNLVGLKSAVLVGQRTSVPHRPSRDRASRNDTCGGHVARAFRVGSSARVQVGRRSGTSATRLLRRAVLLLHSESRRSRARRIADPAAAARAIMLGSSTPRVRTLGAARAITRRAGLRARRSVQVSRDNPPLLTRATNGARTVSNARCKPCCMQTPCVMRAAARRSARPARDAAVRSTCTTSHCKSSPCKRLCARCMYGFASLPGPLIDANAW